MPDKPGDKEMEREITKILEVMRAQYEVSRAISARRFRAALLYGVFFTIFWTVVGQLIPPGNWMIAFNIVMLLISIWIIAPLTINFFRMRMDWTWLAIVLSAIVYLGVVVGIRSLIISVFY